MKGGSSPSINIHTAETCYHPRVITGFIKLGEFPKMLNKNESEVLIAILFKSY